MAVTIAEAIVNLGVKGSDSALNALGSAQKGVGLLGSMSLEAKAGIIGIFYELEQALGAAGRFGTTTLNTSVLLGQSEKSIQQYKYALRQFGVSAEDTAQTLSKLKDAMTDTLYKGKPPEGLFWIAQTLNRIHPGSINQNSLLEFQKDPTKLLMALREYDQVEKNLGLRNERLRTFGLSDDMIAGLAQWKGDPSVLLNKAPINTDAQISKLHQIDAAWATVDAKLQTGINSLYSKHGLQLTKDIGDLIPKILKLADSFQTLAERLKVLQGIGKAFEGWGEIFEVLTKLTDATATKGSLIPTPGQRSGFDKNFEELEKGLYNYLNGDKFIPGYLDSHPKVPASIHKTLTLNNKQDLHFAATGVNPRDTTTAADAAIKQALHNENSLTWFN